MKTGRAPCRVVIGHLGSAWEGHSPHSKLSAPDTLSSNVDPVLLVSPDIDRLQIVEPVLILAPNTKR